MPRKQKREFEKELEPIHDPLLRVILSLNYRAFGPGPDALRLRREMVQRAREGVGEFGPVK
jgi:hypothetical protein